MFSLARSEELRMTFRIAIATVALTLLFSFAGAWRGDAKQTAAEDEFKPVFKNLADDQTPGAAVLIRENGRTLFAQGYGVKDLQTRSGIDSHANFRLASCTKQFTAMAIMLLVHDGKLHYGEHLTDVFPEFPHYGKAITMRNLLNHTSGLPDYESLMEETPEGPSQWTESQQIHDADVLHLLETQTHGKFASGTRWSYSNSGYVVLGLIVGKVSGEPFEDFLHDRIFAPLGMNHTLAYARGKNEIPDRTYGYSKEGNKFVETDQSATSATLGDGGVYSNIEDLNKWDDALRNHTLLTASEVQPAFVPVKLADGSLPNWSSDPGDENPQAGKPVSYGFGWFLDDYRGHRRMWHYGETTGFRTIIDRFEENSFTVIILCNRTDLDPQGFASQAADLYFSTHR